MTTTRTLGALCTAVILSISTGCGSGEDGATTSSDGAPPSADTTDGTTTADGAVEDEAAATETVTPADDAAGGIDQAGDATDHDESVGDEPEEASSGGLDGGEEHAPCPELADEYRETLDGAVPEAPAPDGLADAALPADVDEVIELFDVLADELIGGTKAISAGSPGHLMAAYQPPGLASQYGFQAMEMRDSFIGSVLPEPRADMFVAFWVLSDDDDWVVELAGHEGDLYWVTFTATSSGYGIDGTEYIYSVAFGEACRPWGFTAAAPSEAGRDELIAAFVDAAEQVAAAPDPGPATPDEQAAEVALLTPDDLGPDWFALPNIPQDAQAFHELVTTAMADEQSCAEAVRWVEREGVVLSGLLDVIAASSIAGAESPRFVSGRDGGEVTHTVMVFENADRRNEAFRSARDLGWVECAFAIYDDVVHAQFGAASPNGFSASVVSATERSLELGDDTVALRFELALEAPDGSTMGVTQDISIVAVGRAAGAVYQQSFGAELDEERAAEIIGLAADRLVGQFGATG